MLVSLQEAVAITTAIQGEILTEMGVGELLCGAYLFNLSLVTNIIIMMVISGICVSECL